MCRLLGVLTREAAPLNGTLGGELDEFTALADDHADGWGLSCWRDDSLHVARDTASALTGSGFSAATSTVTDAATLHLRKATGGLALTIQNTHPFLRGQYAFSHNGAFSPVDALDGLIDADLLESTAGNTDSERFFLLVLTLLRTHDPAPAIALAAQQVRERAEFVSLNCLLLTDQALYAYSEEDPESEVSRRRGPDFFRLRYHAGDERVVVGSSGMPTAAAEWQVLPYRSVLEVRRGDLAMTVHPPEHSEGGRSSVLPHAGTEKPEMRT